MQYTQIIRGNLKPCEEDFGTESQDSLDSIMIVADVSKFRKKEKPICFVKLGVRAN